MIKQVVSYISAVAMLSILGCNMPYNSTTPKESEVSVLDNTTAEQLHEICGSLLLFQNSHNRLPKSLDELIASTSLSKSKTIDPATGKKFWYVPAGFAHSEKCGLIVLLAEPASPQDVCYGIAVWGKLPMLNSRVVPMEAGAWKKLTAGREVPK